MLKLVNSKNTPNHYGDQDIDVIQIHLKTPIEIRGEISFRIGIFHNIVLHLVLSQIK